MNPPSQDISDILVGAGVGTFGTDLFISKEPDSPDACVTIFDTGGFDPVANYVYDFPTVQIRIRGGKMEYQTAFAKAQDVKDTLHGLSGETWNSTKYVGIWAQGDIIFVGYDESNRPVLTVNFRVHRTI